MEISFPDNYPTESPSVSIFSPIPHPHVINNRICLDLLSDYSSYFQANTDSSGRAHATGWSSAYSVISIMLQMQSKSTHFLPSFFKY